MKMHSHHPLRAVLRISSLLIAAALLGGCVSKSETFIGKTSDQVWTALVAVAKTPDYRDPDPAMRWTVRENDVYVDEPGRRIEILRRLERDLHNPASKPRHEDIEWKFQIVMDSGNPPQATFTTRGFSVPAHTWEEADRYFKQVWEVTGGKSEALVAVEAAATQPGPPASQPHAYEK